MTDIDGRTGAAPLWAAFMQAVYADDQLRRTLAYDGRLPALEFERPAGITRRLLCALSSVTPGSSDCRVNQSEWFLDTPPTPTGEAMLGKVRWEEVDPAVLRVPALRLADTNRTVGTASTSSSQYCRYDEGVDLSILSPDSVSQIFLAPPRNNESLVEANLWAQSHGLVVLPARPCTGGIEIVDSSGTQEVATAWRIASPQSGQVVNGSVTVSGTANFQPDTKGYYLVELGIPGVEGQDIQWVRVGGEHATPVVNGQLVVLDASTLVPGDYFLRLSVYQNGSAVGDPYIVPFLVGGVQAAELPETADEAGRVVDVSKIASPSEAQVNPPPPTPAPPANSSNNCGSLSGDCP
jgi:hypothetical protein